jgi:hypothetical protein
LPVLEFNEATHTYTDAGREVVSVTQALSRVGNRKTNDGRFESISGSEWCSNEVAADFGKALHAIAVYELSSVEYEYDEAMSPWVANLKRFLKDHEGMKKIDIERPLQSKLYRYCGTTDFYCQLASRNLIVDWKSATTMQTHWRLQLSGYSQLVKEEYKFKSLCDTWTVLISDTDYKIDKRTALEVQGDFNKFLSVLNVYKL